MTDDRAALTARLLPYMHHLSHCSFLRNGVCNCGFAEALEALGAALASEEGSARVLLEQAYERGHWDWPTTDEPTRAKLRDKAVQEILASEEGSTPLDNIDSIRCDYSNHTWVTMRGKEPPSSRNGATVQEQPESREGHQEE